MFVLHRSRTFTRCYGDGFRVDVVFQIWFLSENNKCWQSIWLGIFFITMKNSSKAFYQIIVTLSRYVQEKLDVSFLRDQRWSLQKITDNHVKRMNIIVLFSLKTYNSFNEFILLLLLNLFSKISMKLRWNGYGIIRNMYILWSANVKFEEKQKCFLHR